MSHTAPENDPFLHALTRAYRRLGMEGRGVLVAVSGGADSLALLLATAEVAPSLRMRVEAATVDHGARPGSAAEAVEVQRLCEARGLACHLSTLKLSAGPGFEARARTRRYEALEAARSARGLDHLATAHTASDQAETLLMRLSRGSSLRGARGVHERREALIRPLLFATRSDVEAFLAARKVGFARDPMNEDPSFFRVRIRSSVLPALEEAAGPGAASRLARFALSAAEDERFLAELAADAFRRLTLARTDLTPVPCRSSVGARSAPESRPDCAAEPSTSPAATLGPNGPPDLKLPAPLPFRSSVGARSAPESRPDCAAEPSTSPAATLGPNGPPGLELPTPLPFRSSVGARSAPESRPDCAAEPSTSPAATLGPNGGLIQTASTLDAVGLAALPESLRSRVLALLLEGAGLEVSSLHLDSALEALLRGGSVQLPGDLLLRCEGGRVRLEAGGRTARAAASEVETWLHPEAPPVRDEASGLALRLTRDGNEAELRVAVPAVEGPLVVRRRRKGDRLLSGSVKRRLQDVLVDARVPREVRDLLPVVATPGGEVLAVVGVFPPGRPPEPGQWFVTAHPLGGERAQDWLVRYKLRAAPTFVRGPK